MYRGEAVTLTKVRFSAENARRCWDQCKSRCQHDGRRAAVDRFNQQNRWKKRGLAIVPIKYGIGFSESSMNQVGGRRRGDGAAATLSLCLRNRRRRWSTSTRTVPFW